MALTDWQAREITVGTSSLRVIVEPGGRTTVEICAAGAVLWRCGAPIEIEHYNGGERQEFAAGYTTLGGGATSIEATGACSAGGAQIVITDRWQVAGDHFRLDRTCRVASAGRGGFLTRIRFALAQPPGSGVKVFVPGMIYGGPEHLTKSAIGGADVWQRGRAFTVLIREDRMPAPMAAFYVPDGVHLTCFDAAPSGATMVADSRDTEGQTLVLDGMRLNSLGFEGDDDGLRAVFCAPANEGEVTYSGTTFPLGQLRAWRRRYQVLRAGATVSCAVGLRLSHEADFPACAVQAWRAVFAQLGPKAKAQDVDRITDVLVRRLAALVRAVPGSGRGLPNALDAMTKNDLPGRPAKAILGFTGKNLEAANFMLRWADDHPGAEGDAMRKEAESIIATFCRLRVDPPEGEGFSLETGEPMLAIPRHQRIYLRSFGDDMKSLARAYLRERSHGREHPAWRAWLERFGQWLLSQQREDGSFPRSWHPGSGDVLDPSPFSTYNPIPFLTHMQQMTGDDAYLAAARRAGHFCWQAGQGDFVFVGGTIDNPDIIDKEAGTLSLEAYLALYFATQDPIWRSVLRGQRSSARPGSTSGTSPCAMMRTTPDCIGRRGYRQPVCN